MGHRLQPAVGGQIPHAVRQRRQRHDQLGGFGFGRGERHIAGIDDAQALVVTDLHEQMRITRERILAVGVGRVGNLAQGPGGTQVQVQRLTILHRTDRVRTRLVEATSHAVGQRQVHHTIEHALGRRAADAGRPGNRRIGTVVGTAPPGTAAGCAASSQRRQPHAQQGRLDAPCQRSAPQAPPRRMDGLQRHGRQAGDRSESIGWGHGRLEDRFMPRRRGRAKG